jgi:predicted SAM-dependent methyltransferase
MFSSHFLEHLTFSEGINFLKECHRVMKPRGYVSAFCSQTLNYWHVTILTAQLVSCLMKLLDPTHF